MIQGTTQAVLSQVIVGGKSAIPVPVSTVLADTGNLAAGEYLVEISMGYADTVLAGKGLSAEHRNAADTATVREFGICPAGSSFSTWIERMTVAQDESIRVITLAVVGAAGSVASASIRAYRLTTP